MVAPRTTELALLVLFGNIHATKVLLLETMKTQRLCASSMDIWLPQTGVGTLLKSLKRANTSSSLIHCRLEFWRIMSGRGAVYWRVKALTTISGTPVEIHRTLNILSCASVSVLNEGDVSRIHYFDNLCPRISQNSVRYSTSMIVVVVEY